MNRLRVLWFRLPDSLKRALHTFWQTALATLLASALGVHSLSDLKALAIACLAAGLSAVKSSLLG